MLCEHEFSCDTAALVETGAGFIWLSLRDLKSTWPKTYKRFCTWHKKKTGQSPAAFLNRSASNSPSAPAEDDGPTCAEAVSEKNGGLAGVQFHPQTLEQFTCAISQGNYSLVQQEFQFFWSNQARASSSLAKDIATNLLMLLSLRKLRRRCLGKKRSAESLVARFRDYDRCLSVVFSRWLSWARSSVASSKAFELLALRSLIPKWVARKFTLWRTLSILNQVSMNSLVALASRNLRNSLLCWRQGFAESVFRAPAVV